MLRAIMRLYDYARIRLHRDFDFLAVDVDGFLDVCDNDRNSYENVRTKFEWIACTVALVKINLIEKCIISLIVINMLRHIF